MRSHSLSPPGEAPGTRWVERMAATTLGVCPAAAPAVTARVAPTCAPDPHRLASRSGAASAPTQVGRAGRRAALLEGWPAPGPARPAAQTPDAPPGAPVSRGQVLSPCTATAELLRSVRAQRRTGRPGVLLTREAPLGHAAGLPPRGDARKHARRAAFFAPARCAGQAGVGHNRGRLRRRLDTSHRPRSLSNTFHHLSPTCSVSRWSSGAGPSRRGACRW